MSYCLIIKEKWSYKRKSALNNKTKNQNYSSASPGQRGRFSALFTVGLSELPKQHLRVAWLKQAKTNIWNWHLKFIFYFTKSFLTRHVVNPSTQIFVAVTLLKSPKALLFSRFPLFKMWYWKFPPDQQKGGGGGGGGETGLILCICCKWQSIIHFVHTVFSKNKMFFIRIAKKLPSKYLFSTRLNNYFHKKART